MAEPSSTSVVIPAFNEAAGISGVVQGVRQVGTWHEVLVIDDGSTDSTADLAHAAGARVIRQPYNKGLGAAIKRGVRAAGGVHVLIMDGDGQHRPEDARRLIARLGDYDLVVGARPPETQATPGRRLGNALLNDLASRLTAHPVADLTSGFRAARADVLREFLHMLPNGFSSAATITLAAIKAGYSVTFEPTAARRRQGSLQDPIRARRLQVLVDPPARGDHLQSAAHLRADQPAPCGRWRRLHAVDRRHRNQRDGHRGVADHARRPDLPDRPGLGPDRNAAHGRTRTRTRLTMARRHTVALITTSYPRFPGDLTGTAVEPIAHGVAARGHTVHVVAPWHPFIRRSDREGGVHFHFYRYAPWRALNVFGYAGALRADVSMRPAAYAVAPLALIAAHRLARRVIRRHRATVIHAHWVIPGGVNAAAAAGSLPVVVSLHGSDLFLAERNALARVAARTAFRRADRVTACSTDLHNRAIALGADSTRTETLLHGVDMSRFAPDPGARQRVRAAHGLPDQAEIVFAVGRLVRKKGFEYLVDAMARLAPRRPALRLVLAGSGDLDAELRARAEAGGVGDRVTWLGAIPHDQVAGWLAAADISAAPSVVDDAGNVDGLPNTILEALASATPVVATHAGGIASVAVDRETALIVRERDAEGLAAAIDELLSAPILRTSIGCAAREKMQRHHTWERVAERFETAYELAAEHARHR